MDVGESFGAGLVSSRAARRIPIAAKTERQMLPETGTECLAFRQCLALQCAGVSSQCWTVYMESQCKSCFQFRVRRLQTFPLLQNVSSVAVGVNTGRAYRPVSG